MALAGRVQASALGAAIVGILAVAAFAVWRPAAANEADWLREELRLHFEINRMAVLHGEAAIEETDKEVERIAGNLTGETYSAERRLDVLAMHRQEAARLFALVDATIHKNPVWPDTGLAPEEHALRARILLEKIRVDDNALRVVGADLRPPLIEAEALLHYARGTADFPREESVFAAREALIDAALAALPGAAPAAEDAQAADGGGAAGKSGQNAAAAANKPPAAADIVAVLPAIIGQVVAAGRGEEPGAACNGFAGLWESGAGPLLIDATGLGTYDGGASTIWGTIDGSKLAGPFREPAKEGTVSITLSDDGRSFSGSWSFPNGEWGGDWSGTCVAGVADAPAVQAMVAGAAGAQVGDAALQLALDAFDQILAAAAGDAPAPDQAAKGALNCTGFAGRWTTNYGDLFIEADPADPSKLSGSYVEGDGSLSGTVNGRRLEGKFAQAGYGSGSFVLDLSEDGYTFKGSWTLTDGGDGGGEWTGTCAPPVAG